MSKTNKKKKNKRIKSLVLLLFLTIVMLSTATYAWFTSNRTVKIDTINVNIAASSGLQISADATTWKTVLANSDLTGASTTYAAARNFLQSTMAPVSTAGTVTSGDLKLFSGSVEGDQDGDMALKTAAATDGDGSYVVFDIFLKVDVASVVYLETGTGTVYKSGTTDKGLQNAARIGFVNEGNVSTTATAASAQALNGGNTVTIIEPNYDVHTDNGKSNASTYYNITTSNTGAAAIDYYGVDAVITTPIKLLQTNPPTLTTTNTNFAQNWGTIIKTNAAYSSAASGFASLTGSTPTAANKYVQVFSLPAGVTKVRVYMWVEGQDVDCENNASGSDLSYNVIFTLDSGPSGS